MLGLCSLLQFEDRGLRYVYKKIWGVSFCYVLFLGIIVVLFKNLFVSKVC